MGMLHYLIADHHVCLDFAPSKVNGTHLVESLQPFLADGQQPSAQPLLTLTVDDATRPLPKESRHRIRVFDTGNGDTIVDRTEDGSYQFIIKDIDGRDCCLLIADSTFAHCRCALNGSYAMRHFGLNNALMLTYAFATARHQTVLIHASLVRKDGFGYAFTAKSGTGKSTQVSMWLRHLPGCDLMNDDNPIIRVIDGTPYIYGSPWSGKTPCYRNTRAPLGAITRIDRDTTNHVLPLQPIEAFATVLSGCSTMKWDEQIHQACCDTVTAIVESTRIFSLHCLPNREAAEVCWEGIGVKEEGGLPEEERGERREEREQLSWEEGESYVEERGRRKEEGGTRKEERGKRKEERDLTRGHEGKFWVHAMLCRGLDAFGWLLHLGRTHRTEGAPAGAGKTMQLHNEVFLPEVVSLLQKGHTVTLPLRGFSMRPFLEDGRDKALLVKAETPQVGDAVLAEISPKTFVLHRIHAIEGDHVTLLGDGNLAPEHCRLCDVHGKAVAFYRKGRQQPDRTDGRKWRVYSWVWTHLRPLRRYLLAIHRRVIL